MNLYGIEKWYLYLNQFYFTISYEFFILNILTLNYIRKSIIIKTNVPFYLIKLKKHISEWKIEYYNSYVNVFIYT